MRAGSKGPLVVEAVQRRVVWRTHRRQQGDPETLVVSDTVTRQAQVVKVDEYLSNAAPETPLGEFAGGQSGTSRRRMSPAEQE